MHLRDLSRAAAAIRTLSNPRSAAVLARVPPRPGATIDEGELMVSSGLPVDQAAAAIARLSELGIVSRQDGAVALDREGLESLAAALTAESPLHGLVERHPALRPYVSDGRWTHDPAKPGLTEEMYVAFGELFKRGSELTEADVTAFLAQLHPDPAALRRGLIDRGLLHRPPGTDAVRVPD